MEELARIGLVGIARHPVAGVMDGEHPTDAMVAALRIDDPERRFLLTAGARAVFEQCGHMGTRGFSPPPQSPPETLPCASSRVANLLEQAMGADPPYLLVEFLNHLRAIGCLLPPESLPQALSLKKRDLREGLRPLLGERGRWLARLNPEWQWATTDQPGSDDVDRASLTRQWEEGNLDERRRALETLRGADPPEARRWLEATIGKEKADHRARFVESLRIRLESEDEPFLESLLGDRSEQVRRAAASCLAKLPGSALAQRMTERAGGMITLQSRGVLRKSQRLVGNAPEEIDAAWVRDGIPAKPPAGRGKRAVWMETVLAAVRPGFWCDRFGMTPSELIEAVAGDDFADAVLIGWTRAVTALADSDATCAAWFGPLATYWTSAVGKLEKAWREALEHLQALVSQMPAGEAEGLLPRLLQHGFPERVSSAMSLLESLPKPWSESFGFWCLSTMRSVLPKPVGANTYSWLNALNVAAVALPRDCFSAALEPWLLPDSNQAHPAAGVVGREIDAFTETILMRQRFYGDVFETTASPPVQTSP